MKQASYPKRQAAHRMVIGRMSIDRQLQQVRLPGRAIHLTPLEFELLWVLAREPQKVFAREELLRLVWGESVFVTVRTVDVHMAKPRQKLRTDEWPDVIETVWGMGYRLRTGW
jgi:DNA-binding response OmpR family regulator